MFETRISICRSLAGHCRIRIDLINVKTICKFKQKTNENENDKKKDVLEYFPFTLQKIPVATRNIVLTSDNENTCEMYTVMRSTELVWIWT